MSTTDITPLADDALSPGSGPSLEPARKLRPNHQRTLKLMRIGLRRRFPNLDEAALQQVYLQMRERCHNRNY
jgi:hypothetical protein